MILDIGTFVCAYDVFGNYVYGHINDIVIDANDNKLYKVHGLLYHASMLGCILSNQQILNLL